MNWNDHSRLEGCHAFLSASGYHWINYDEDKIASRYKNHLATLKGTELHEFAATAIRLKRKLKGHSDTLSLYVNDAIGFKMQPEQILYYSENAFGTADAISFRDDFLRIHDLKTGEVPAHMEQLEVYAALFCLEYKKRPGDLKMELRIYQANQVLVLEPECDKIAHIMDKIVTFDKIISHIKEEEG